MTHKLHLAALAAVALPRYKAGVIPVMAAWGLADLAARILGWA